LPVWLLIPVADRIFVELVWVSCGWSAEFFPLRRVSARQFLFEGKAVEIAAGRLVPRSTVNGIASTGRATKFLSINIKMPLEPMFLRFLEDALAAEKIVPGHS